jgi:hypothetical protein
MRATEKQALYRRLAVLLARLPRGYQTVLRIVRQRSGSPDDYRLAQLALSAAALDLHHEMQPIKAIERETKRRERARERTG